MGSLFLALVLAASSAAGDQPCRLADAHVERAIAARAAKLGGAEYCDYRLYSSLADLDGDGKDDFAVTFNVEGPGNEVRSFLFVFLSSAPAGSPPLDAETGERGRYLPAALRGGANHQLIVETQTWRPKDAMCCPSGKGKLVFAVSAGKLRRLSE